jgi:two-component system, OmpR family, sensor histidine kinase MprB
VTDTAPAPELVEAAPASRLGDRLQRVTLRTRVTLLAAICVGAAVALVSLGAFLTVRDSMYRQLDQDLLDRATSAAAGPAVVLSPSMQQVPAAILTAANVRISLEQADGREIVGPWGRPPTGAQELDVARGLLPMSRRIDERTDSEVIAVPSARESGAALVMSQSLRPTKQTLAHLSLVLIVIGGAGILLAAAAGTAVARAGLRPVQRLTDATERVARTGDLRPIPVSGDEELSRLTLSFNKMLGALAESQEQQRRLVADAGHELRTPLTSLRTNLELLMASSQPGAPALSQEDRRDMFTDVHAQITELSALVGDLVELAREDVPQMVHEPLELVDVVERALSRVRRRAPSIEFVTNLTPWSMTGDATALERAVLNVLDNAAKWSPEGSRVRVELRPEQVDWAVLEVADSGPGIAAADRPYVFERFYRSSDARTLPGSGLGLSIVKQVAERHGGSVLARVAPEGGAMLRLHLPGSAG